MQSHVIDVVLSSIDIEIYILLHALTLARIDQNSQCRLVVLFAFQVSMLCQLISVVCCRPNHTSETLGTFPFLSSARRKLCIECILLIEVILLNRRAFRSRQCYGNVLREKRDASCAVDCCLISLCMDVTSSIANKPQGNGLKDNLYIQRHPCCNRLCGNFELIWQQEPPAK